MQLSNVEEKKKDKGIGYKVVLYKEGKLYSNHGYRIGIHNEENSSSYEEAEDGTRYLTGFHILRRLEEAVLYSLNLKEVHQKETLILKVKYSNVVASGYSGTFEVVVARKMDVIDILKLPQSQNFDKVKNILNKKKIAYKSFSFKGTCYGRKKGFPEFIEEYDGPIFKSSNDPIVEEKTPQGQQRWIRIYDRYVLNNEGYISGYEAIYIPTKDIEKFEVEFITLKEV